ncbi:HTTM domain-containing protein [Adhaeribacter sp. BT258]|uniref:HTTM domain-containing protein n=1 Tax=Adhaeribacter terrigena TaxID=2793070 RepID=A0ABS1C2D4_9BACT|nr:HTTM domain-containing protein [Adhaeribacter terrigena]MBK0403484.1 HTTM domain-containing protein [Adhaeribacter terrigena]
MQRLKHHLFKPIDIASLVFFRIAAGILLSFEQINQFLTGDYLNYIQPKFHFSYLFFPWLKPFPETGMYALWAITILAGFMVAAGAFYRLSTVVLFIGYSLLFLMEETEFVNHFYLYCLLCFWLMFIPAHRAFSVDVWRKPELKRSYTPAWTVYIFIFQISLVYFYAGLAKLHTDWLLAKPLKIWMGYKAAKPVIGGILAHEFTPWIMSYAGLAFDLLFAPLLLYRRTRWLGFTLAAMFHLSNALIFGLATFPWFSLTLTSLYFSPSWPRKLPFFRKYIPAFQPENLALKTVSAAHQKLLLYGILTYATLQMLIPFRHFLYPGNVNWTEEGHKFSWHMMLRAKDGMVNFQVKAPKTEGQEEARFPIYPEKYLTPNQINKMADQPDLMLQFAHFLKAEYEKQGYKNPEVYVGSQCSLNGRDSQPLISPQTNLAAQQRSLKHYDWILPLQD